MEALFSSIYKNFAKMLNNLIEIKKEFVGFRFEKSELEELKQIAAKEKISLSEAIRRKIKNKNE